VIKISKPSISSGPFGDTKSWVGYDICSYEGFYCENPPGNKFAIALASIDFNSFQLNALTLDGFINKLPDITLIHANTTNFNSCSGHEHFNILGSKV